MATYQSKTNIQPAVYPSFTQSVPGPCSPATATYPSKVFDVSPGIVRNYTPYLQTETRNDPTRVAKRNWSKIKRSGAISMTPLTVEKTVIEDFVVSRERAVPTNWWQIRTCSRTPPTYDIRDFDVQFQRWTENDHLGSLSGVVQYVDDYGSFKKDYLDQVQDAIHSTQSAAYAASLSSFDVLTQLAEGRETLTYMQDKVKEAANVLKKLAGQDQSTWRRARGLTADRLIKSSDKAFRRLGSRWMEYRYAIMPLVYSIRDINELMGARNQVYKTDRDKSSVIMTLDRPDIPLETHGLYCTASFEANVRSTVKSAYTQGALHRVFAQSAFNPFKTAWELVPYSFVVDWFLNVGDVITSQTSLDLSSQKMCCTSVKETLILSIWRHDSTSDTRTFVDSSPAFGPTGQRTRTIVSGVRNQDDLLRVEATERYRRNLWSKPSPKLTVSPYLNWKRYIDGLVLGYQPTKKLLRSL